MPCKAMLVLMALGAKVCSAQPQVGDPDVLADTNPWGETTQEPTVKPPSDVLCPIMTSIGVETFLEIEPWSFMKTINVKQASQVYTESNDAETESTETETEPFLSPSVQTRVQSSEVAPTPVPQSRLIGRVIAMPFAWTHEYGLYDPYNHKLIAKIVNPGFFWDESQDIYSCAGVKLGSIQTKLSFVDMILNRFIERKIKDTYGNHVATLEEDQIPSNNWFGDKQYFLYMKDISGTPLASMRHPRGGLTIPPFKQSWSVEIEVLTQNVMAPPPAMQPEFMTLAFANSLAASDTFGPYWSGIMSLIFWILLFCLCCCCCCTGSGFAEKVKQGGEKGAHEKESLLGHGGHGAEAKDKANDFWNCCSRKVTPQQTNMEKAKGAAHGAADKTAAAAHGGH